MATRGVFPALPSTAVLNLVAASSAAGCGSVWWPLLLFGSLSHDLGVDSGVVLLELSSCACGRLVACGPLTVALVLSPPVADASFGVAPQLFGSAFGPPLEPGLGLEGGGVASTLSWLSVGASARGCEEFHAMKMPSVDWAGSSSGSILGRSPWLGPTMAGVMWAKRTRVWSSSPSIWT
jgi:hypothetical protein